MGVLLPTGLCSANTWWTSLQAPPSLLGAQGLCRGPSTTPMGGGEVAHRAQGSLSLGGSGLSPHCNRELGGTCSLEGPLLLPPPLALGLIH